MNIYIYIYIGFPDGSVNPRASAEDVGSIPGSGRSPGEGNGNPVQYSCLENPWTEEPGGLQSQGLQETGFSNQTATNTVLHHGCTNFHSRKRVRHDLVTKQPHVYMHTHDGILLSLFFFFFQRKKGILLYISMGHG